MMNLCCGHDYPANGFREFRTAMGLGAHPNCGVLSRIPPLTAVPRSLLAALQSPLPVSFYGLKNFSTFAFTAASILIIGGQERLKPSPGSFFVASMPSLRPAES